MAKPNNTDIPGPFLDGAMVAVANATAPSYTDGNMVLLTTDTSGNLRVTNSPTGTQTVSISQTGTANDVDVASIAAGDNNIGNVDVVTLPSLPAGTNNIGDVDVLTLPAGTVAGSASLPAGTNNIGDVDVLTVPSNMSVNLNQVAGAVIATGGGVELGAQRVTIANDSTGVLSVDDNGGSLTIDGTVTANAGTGTFQVGDAGAIINLDAAGDVQVDVLSIAAGDNNIGNVDVVTLPALVAGTANIGDVDVVSVIPGTTATSLGKAEDAASADADVGVAAYSVRQDTIAVSTTLDGDYQPLKSTSTGRLYTSATIDAAIPAGTNNIGDVDVLTLPALAAGTNNIGDVDVLTLPSLPAGTNNIGDVDVLTMPTTTVTGTVAHDDIDSGNPHKIGFRAVAHSANPTAVAAGDRTDWLANRHGIPWVMGGHPNIVTVRANYTAAQTDTAVVTVAAGLKIVVTRCSVLADNANTVDVQARVGFGATTTPTTTGVVLTHPGIAAGSGVIEGSGSGILGIGADGEDLRITSEVPTGGSIDVVVSYFTIES